MADKTFDRRVLGDGALEFIRACQRRVPCHLGGGAALSGAHLSHRLSADIDLFCHQREEHRELVRLIGDVGAETNVAVEIVRDAGTFVRAAITIPGQPLELDLVYEALPDLEAPPPPVEGITLESLTDLRAAKITCLLSRREPRDLVDLMFLDRAGYPPEKDIPLALKKDAGIDPAILAWLLGQYPTRPLPIMLLPLAEDELGAYRDDLRERIRKIATPDEDQD